ncbi:MAG: MOSC domain-containing protein [Gammaproteobacteria bacterium]
MSLIKLSEIYVYPVKSLAGFKVNQWPVTETGLQYDRNWMLIDPNHRFLSQRQLPKMSLINTAISDDRLILTAPAMPLLTLPLQANGGELLETSIWQDRCLAFSVSDSADQWFSVFLGQECRLVSQAEHSIRPVDPHYAHASDQTAFSDGFPFLLISENSLASLNQHMKLSLPMSRFRPNLVISGCASYAEDSWRAISIGEISFRLPKPCSRCSITTIDAETGEAGKEPLKTLNRIRKWNQQVFFGQNALHDNTGQLTVGDRLLVLTTGPNQPPLS